MKKRKFTWLDGVICGVVLLALIVGAVFLFGGKGDPVTPDTKTYEVTMRFTRATDTEFDYYAVGDTMYFQNRTGKLGTITHLEEIDRVYEKYNKEKGENVLVTDPERKTVVMKVQVEGSLNGGKFTVGDQKLHIGMVFYPQSNTTRSIMTIWDIKEVQA